MDSDRLSAEIRREFPPEHPDPQFEVADIVRLHGDAYRAEYNPSFEQGRALHAIETCRTSALGMHIELKKRRRTRIGHLSEMIKLA